MSKGELKQNKNKSYRIDVTNLFVETRSEYLRITISRTCDVSLFEN